MKYFKILFLLIIIIAKSKQLFAQDTLPKYIGVKTQEGLANISWVNDYGIVKQITIQRSTDSLRHFASIYSDSTPMNRRGFYSDTKAKLLDYYYRIFIQLPEGKYLFTKTIKLKREWLLPRFKIPPSVEYALDSNWDKIRDSLLKLTDSLEKLPKSFAQSDYIFTDKKGNVLVLLPNAENRNYSIQFFDENNRKVLTIPNVKESNLILERYNFYKSGWYFFKIMDGAKRFEEHKFYLPPLAVAIKQ